MLKMSKEQTPIGIAIKDIVATVLKIIIGEPAKQVDMIAKPQDKSLSETALNEIENLTKEK